MGDLLVSLDGLEVPTVPRSARGGQHGAPFVDRAGERVDVEFAPLKE